MTFDEFFKKKRIDLPALEKVEPALFSEFKLHYVQMGEKSFDHTKKYWFNKIRRQFPLAPEVKTEKVHIENPLAEQTIIESLTEQVSTPPSPKVGFTPKFRAANIAKPPIEDKKEVPPAPTIVPEDQPAETSAVKPAGFIPRFKMKPKEETKEPAQESSTAEPVQPSVPDADKEHAVVTPKLGFKPKFKTAPKPADEDSNRKDLPFTESSTSTPEVNEAAEQKDQDPAFEQDKRAMQNKANETERLTNSDSSLDKPTQTAGAKPAYKPRFIPPSRKE
jgi:hypothetical protein